MDEKFAFYIDSTGHIARVKILAETDKEVCFLRSPNGMLLVSEKEKIFYTLEDIDVYDSWGR